MLQGGRKEEETYEQVLGFIWPYLCRGIALPSPPVLLKTKKEREEYPQGACLSTLASCWKQKEELI